MQQKLPRHNLVKQVQQALSEFPVVSLLGPRQIGKTTLALEIQGFFEESTLFDLERASHRQALEQTPELTLKNLKGLVIIDEVQRLPSLFETLRPLCDDPQRKASYLLLGSASTDLVKGVSETLAGRVAFVPIPGFSIDEIAETEQNRLWLRGGFPRSFLSTTDEASQRWLDSFRQTFLERDIPNLGIKVSAATLDRFWHMLAHYHGQIWNATDLGRSMGVAPGTANTYRDILVGTYMLRTLQPWFENIGKRQVKAPKVYIRDSGLLHLLFGISTMTELSRHARYGASFEGFALEQTLIRFGSRDAYFWKTQRGAELDLLLLRNGRRWGFEYKCSDAPSTSKAMHIAIEDLDIAHLYVIYPGIDRYSLDKKITALPLRDLWKVELKQIV